MNRKFGTFIATAVMATSLVGISGVAEAGGKCRSTKINCYKTWETKAGARYHAQIWVRASTKESGQHPKKGYVRFTRKKGPALDTGRQYPLSASSKKDTRVRTKKVSVWGSPLWGDDYTTKFNYGFKFFK